MNRKFSEFVSFDIAKQLKDAGFDLETDYWYNESGKRLPYSNMLVEQMYNDALKKNKEFYSCPYYSEVWDWFMSKNIILCIDYESIAPLTWTWNIQFVGDRLKERRKNKKSPLVITETQFEDFHECFNIAITTAINYLNDNTI